jgi:hypothetical protein
MKPWKGFISVRQEKNWSGQDNLSHHSLHVDSPSVIKTEKGGDWARRKSKKKTERSVIYGF